MVRSKTVKSLFYLYLVQVANYLFPLLTLPYLARVLGPDGFGVMTLGQTLALYLQLLVEYGFSLSGTREVARHREDREAVACIVSGVMGARVFLLLPATLLAFLALYLPPFKGREDIVGAAFFWAVAWGFSPAWVFQGLEHMREVAFLEVLTRGLAALGVFFLVRSPEHAYLPLMLNGVGAAVATAIGVVWLGRTLPLRPPSLRGALNFLVLGGRFFFPRLVVSFYAAANPIILSFFASPLQVGLYAGAERVAKAMLGLIEPFNRLFFPRLSHLVRYDPRIAGLLAVRVLVVMGCLAGVGALFLWVFSPWLVRFLLGTSYEESVPIVKVLVLLLPLIAMSNLLGIQMLSWGMDRSFNTVILSAGLLNIVLTTALSALGGPLGLAWAAVLVEAWVVGGMVWYLHRHRRLPWEVAQ
ncbi:MULTISPECIES: oligosaccharide flippase family protein [Thermus]|uniref:oligosaccharide flippase family protein n=1 Tax=Thermus hydrothermalis TaxID=2908148 RepID=UPI00242B0B51|nr:oligosaccharide flippase family protein [Thermus hydrothermalis]